MVILQSLSRVEQSTYASCPVKEKVTSQVIINFTIDLGICELSFLTTDSDMSATGAGGLMSTLPEGYNLRQEPLRAGGYND